MGDTRRQTVLGRNPSRDDPAVRSWLTSGALFESYQQIRHLGERFGATLDGELFRYAPEGFGLELEVWLTEREVVVAYPDQRRFPSPRERGRDSLRVFPRWIQYLRSGDPLPLGHPRGRSSYGARLDPESGIPQVMWAQAGDWSDAARGWPSEF